jgi:hypothetical protein
MTPRLYHFLQQQNATSMTASTDTHHDVDRPQPFHCKNNVLATFEPSGRALPSLINHRIVLNILKESSSSSTSKHSLFVSSVAREVWRLALQEAGIVFTKMFMFQV